MCTFKIVTSTFVNLHYARPAIPLVLDGLMKSRALNHVVKSLHRRYQTTLIPSIAADNVFISRHESSDAAVLVSSTVPNLSFIYL
jgi:hypothetical protein